MASKKFTQFDTANNTPETELSVGVKGTENFKRRNYLTATTNPTVNDDNSDGFTVGSMWLNTSTGAMYVCQDSTVGAAVWSNGLGYLRLTFNLTQSGTDAPVVTVLNNDLDIELVSDYVTIGNFSIGLPFDILDLTKVQLFVGQSFSSLGTITSQLTINTIDLFTYEFDFTTPKNGVLLFTAFELRFYPGWDA